MRITASIVTFNTDCEELQKCIEALENNGVDLVFISDNSPSATLENFFQKFQSTIYHHNSGNIGYGAAHNVAIKYCQQFSPDYHLVINSDVYFESNVLKKIVDYMDEHTDVGQLIPNTIYPNGELQHVVRLLPRPIDMFARRFLPKKWTQHIDHRFLLQFWDHKTIANIPFHMGCFMFMRMSALEKVGLFDERIFLYTEDIDLTRRIHKYYKTIFFPEATIIHAHKQSSYKSKRVMLLHIKSAIAYFNKWGWFFDCERRLWNREVLHNLKKTSI